MFENTSPPSAANAYEAKTSYEAARLARYSKQARLPQPFGEPCSGVVLVVERAEASARLVDALHRSLAAVKLDGAYVTWSSPYLLEETLSIEPGALVAVGPDAARAIDALNYPLAKTGFSETPEGLWFVWTKGTFGLRLPALTPALVDADAKHRFWRAFLSLRVLIDDEGDLGYRPS